MAWLFLLEAFLRGVGILKMQGGRYLKQESLEALLCALHVRASVASPGETEINIGL